MKLSERKPYIFISICCYLAIGLIWCLLPDKMSGSDGSVTSLTTIKEIAFVIFNAIFFLVVLRTIPDKEETAHDETDILGTHPVKDSPLPRWVAYGFSVGISLFIIFINKFIMLYFNEKPLLVIFMLPIVMSSLLGGLGPGLTATVLAALGIDYYGFHVFNASQAQPPLDLFQLFILMASGILASFLSGILHRERRQADEQRYMLEVAQEPLRLSAERFQLTMEGANIGLWDWNMTNDNFYLSPRWKNKLGYEDDDLKNDLETWKQLIHPDDQTRILGLIKDIEEGRADQFETEFRMLHCEGRYLDILSRAFPVRDKSGQIIRMVGIHVDVTERPLSRKAIMDREVLMEKARQQESVGHWSFDTTTGKVTWSDEVAQIYDMEKNITVSLNFCLRFYHRDHRKAIKHALRGAIKEGTPFDLKLELISVRDTRKFVRMVGFPVFQNDRVARVEGIFQEIEEFKERRIIPEDRSEITL